MFTPPLIKPTCFARKQNEKQHSNLPNDRIHSHTFWSLGAYNGANGAQGSKLLYSWMNTSLIHSNLHMQIQPAQQSFRFRSLLARRRAADMELLSMRVLIGVPKSQLTTIFSAKYQLTTIFLINSQLTTNSV